MDNNILNTWNRVKDSDIYYSFIKSPTAIISSIILFIIFLGILIIAILGPKGLSTFISIIFL